MLNNNSTSAQKKDCACSCSCACACDSAIMRARRAAEEAEQSLNQVCEAQENLACSYVDSVLVGMHMDQTVRLRAQRRAAEEEYFRAMNHLADLDPSVARPAPPEPELWDDPFGMYRIL